MVVGDLCKETLPEEQGDQPHIWDPQLSVPVLGRGVHKIWLLKPVGTLINQVRKKAAWKSRHPLKEPSTNWLTCSQALALGSGGETAAREVPETQRERVSCMASGRGLKGGAPLSLC